MKTIRTKRELRAAKAQIAELRRQLAMLKVSFGRDTASFEFATRGMRQVIQETVSAAAAFEQALAGGFARVMKARNPRTGRLEVPRLLRLMRQAAQLDQAALAVRLGTRQGSISRWEHEGYDGYTLRQLQRIVEALGYDMEILFTQRDATGGAR